MHSIGRGYGNYGACGSLGSCSGGARHVIFSSAFAALLDNTAALYTAAKISAKLSSINIHRYLIIPLLMYEYYNTIYATRKLRQGTKSTQYQCKCAMQKHNQNIPQLYVNECNYLRMIEFRCCTM